jgi:hypothetical protein
MKQGQWLTLEGKIQSAGGAAGTLKNFADKPDIFFCPVDHVLMHVVQAYLPQFSSINFPQKSLSS